MSLNLSRIFFAFALLLLQLSAHSTSEPAIAGTTDLNLRPTHDASIPLSAFAEPAKTIDAANRAQELRVRELEAKVDQAIATLAVERKEREVAFASKQRQEDAYVQKGINEDQVRLTIFRRQLVYHPLILITVLLLVLSSTVLVFLQFRRWNNESNANESSLDLGKEGFKIKTPFVGLMMLVASYAFFYLYILEVYRIRPLT